MSDVTATFQIPFPTGMDRMCDGASFIESMARKVDTILTTFDVDLELLGNVPAAKVYIPATIQIPNAAVDAAVHWTAIEYDTSHLADLTLDDTTLRYSINGYWILGGANAFIAAPPSANAKYQADIFSTVPLQVPVSQSARDNGTDFSINTAVGMNVFVNSGLVGLEGEVSTEVRNGSINNLFVVSRGMYVRWLREI
jgi:hypothetical protein